MGQLLAIDEDDETAEADDRHPEPEPEPDETGDAPQAAVDAQTFLLATVTGSVAVWDLGFNLAVYGDVFFDKYLTLWVLATSVILASFVVPRRHRPIGIGGALMLMLPGTYFVGATFLTQSGRLEGGGGLAEVVSLLSLLVALGTLLVFLASVPYVMYLLARILNPELVNFPSWRYRLGFLAIVMLVGATSIVAGLAHPLYLTCSDFTVSGNDRPSNCTPGLDE
jgi:hypothetical protein